MTSVGVVHLDLMSKGGGEAVAMNVLEALQDDHDLALLTAARPDVDALNEYFDTAVDARSLDVRLAGSLAPAIHRRFGVRYYVLQNALLSRFARRYADEFDLLVSTINELGLPPGSIEYVHFPFDWTVSLENRGDVFHPGIDDDSLYERLCTYLAGVSAADVGENTVFANSGWTAEVFEEAYGVRPEVLHPPVDTREFVDRPWTERENGFVSVGRVERSKRLVELIRVVDGVRERGHDVHLHVVGPTYDDEYRSVVDAMAAEREHVAVEGELPRSELVRLICEHRYGIHGKTHEHFGMAVAEFAAGGAVPFAPATGGQRAVVNGDERLLYRSANAAIEKIDRVLSDRGLQRELRIDAGEIERRFGRDRFQARIVEAVEAALGRSMSSPSAETPAVPETVSTDD